MGVVWTEDQKKVIELRNRNILVSAAAGSGKTAVLVERIMEMICNEEQPVDVDRLLVVTFTKAAAAEMKERIGAAIRKRLAEHPENGWLQKQETLLAHAQITTIDSFCAYILRNHFGEIDLDPSFRVADEGELKLLKKDVLKEILEEEYVLGTPEFLHFVECFATGKKDEVLEEMILKLYEFSVCDPFPEEWLRSLLKKEDFLQEPEIIDYVGRVLRSLLEENEQIVNLCRSIGGPVFYEEAIQSDRILLMNLLNCQTYEQFSEAFRGRSYQALSRKRMPPDVDESKKEAVKKSREHLKRALEILEKQFFYAPSEMLLHAEEAAEPVKKELIRLTIKFLECFEQKKRRRNIVDFSDMEHLALKILVEKKDGFCVPSEIAKSYAEYYVEIMIDEYQDSNLVQEYILTSISGKAFDRNNLFMVGDIKQSIYRFRQARPELFMEKQECYTVEESSSQKINLSKNFRSRKEVLDTVNYIFRRLMIKDFGNIAYDDQAALYCGAAMPEPEKQEDIKPELMILDLQEEEAADKTELEAAMVAVRILELKKTAKVTDKLSGKLRKAEFGDMVILLRSMSGKSDVFSNVLSSYGIPSVTGTSTGYFSSPEIQTMLNFLTVLDNCRQDIPLSAVLHSPIGGITSLEMAQIRSAYPELLFSEACICYAQEGKEDQVKQKLIKFFRLFLTLRQEAEYLPIHKLLWEIYDKTSYERIVRMQPNGEVRRANLQMLVQKALDYENTSYRGLFNFVRYIENLQKYEVDYGMAETGAGEKNAVQIMSIHKSKGLEFPIVFVSCLAKSFNKQDAREKLAIHPDLGLGIDAVDPEKRLKMPTLHKKVIQKKIEQESLGEELRVLYVALTRAKEKLIMTASLEQAERKLEKVQEMAAFFVRTSYEKLWSGGSFLDWIIGACEDGEFPFELRLVSAQELVEKKVAELSLKSFDYEFLRQRKTEISKELAERLTYQYPYQKWETIPGKVSVSELKREDFEENISRVFEEEEMETYVPIFLREEKKMSRAERGTIYHKITENMAFEKIRHSDQAKEEIEALVRKRKISEEEAKAVNPYDFYLFAQTELYRRIGEAKKRNQFYPEQMFVIAKPANEIYPECESTQDVLVQGIIDACFEENGDYVLIDYKTDYVKNEQELVQRYKVQIKIYAEALTQMTGKKVKECLIYSFCLGKEIVLDVDMDHVIG